MNDQVVEHTQVCQIATPNCGSNHMLTRDRTTRTALLTFWSAFNQHPNHSPDESSPARHIPGCQPRSLYHSQVTFQRQETWSFRVKTTEYTFSPMNVPVTKPVCLRAIIAAFHPRSSGHRKVSSVLSTMRRRSHPKALRIRVEIILDVRVKRMSLPTKSQKRHLT